MLAGSRQVTIVAAHVMPPIGVAMAQAAFDYSSDYISRRKVFGQPVASFQHWQFRFADYAMRLEMCRSLYQKAAMVYDKTGNAEADALWAVQHGAEIGRLRPPLTTITFVGMMFNSSNADLKHFFNATRSLVSAAPRSASMVASRLSGTMPRSLTSQPRRCSSVRRKKRLEL